MIEGASNSFTLYLTGCEKWNYDKCLSHAQSYNEYTVMLLGLSGLLLLAALSVQQTMWLARRCMVTCSYVVDKDLCCILLFILNIAISPAQSL